MTSGIFVNPRNLERPKGVRDYYNQVFSLENTTTNSCCKILSSSMSRAGVGTNVYPENVSPRITPPLTCGNSLEKILVQAIDRPPWGW